MKVNYHKTRRKALNLSFESVGGKKIIFEGRKEKKLKKEKRAISLRQFPFLIPTTKAN